MSKIVYPVLNISPLTTDVYDERHALEALRGNTETADIIQTHAGALYNLSIPIDPPQVSLRNTQ